jgi:hypothetical protein
VITAVGRTQSNDFPTTPGAFDTTHNGGDDVCVVRLDPARPPAQQLVYSTFLGATNAEYPAALSVDAAGIATLAGATQSGSYPTTAGAWDTAHNGRWDCFVTRLDLLPRGVTAYGASTAGCAGLMRAGVVAWPQVGNTAFAITCTPSNAVGLLAVGAAPTATPSLLAGAAVWLDLQSPVTTVLIGSTGFGSSVVPVPIPARPALAGLHAFAQHFWLDTCAPGGVSASNALAIVVQP